jgi:hypothetical protein
VGCSTPEDTVQTVLWAIQNRDMATLLTVLTPEAAEKLQAQMDGKQDFFQGSEAIVGVNVVSRQQLADGSIELMVDANNDSHPQPIRFRLINGQWKAEEPR